MLNEMKYNETLPPLANHKLYLSNQINNKA